MIAPAVPALPPVLRPLDEAARSALFSDARTANTFTDQPVSDQELIGIIDLVKWAPTSSNLQPLRVLFVNSVAGRARLVEHMDEGNKAKTLAAPAVAVLAMDTRFHENQPILMPAKPKLYDFFEANEAARTSSARLNSALQAGYFILAVRALGLAAGPMSGFTAAAVDSEFFPKGRLRSILVVNLGHPAKDAYRERMPRLSHDQVIQFA